MEPRAKRARGSAECAAADTGADAGGSACAALASAASLQQFLELLVVRGKDISGGFAFTDVLSHLLGLLAAEVVPPDTSSKKLAQRLAAGEALEVPALPSRPVTAGRFAAYTWVQRRLEDELRNIASVSQPPLGLLARIAIFIGRAHLQPPLGRQLLEDCAGGVLHWLKQHRSDISTLDLTEACCFARGVAQCGVLSDAASGALAKHELFPYLARRVASAAGRGHVQINGQSGQENLTRVGSTALHDCALALALMRPWKEEAQVMRAAGALSKVAVAFAKSLISQGAVGAAQHAEPQVASSMVVGSASLPGSRSGVAKENQDVTLEVVRTGSVLGCVIDGHGRQGAEFASSLHAFMEQMLSSAPGGFLGSHVMAELLLLADTHMILSENIDSRLCGAACALVHVVDMAPTGAKEGKDHRQVEVAHLGDCRVVLGRRKSGEGGQTTWQAIRLTRDHCVGDPIEAARLVARGGRVQCIKPINGQNATDCLGLGPPRLWSRAVSGVPGLAVSRGLGDVMAQTCGLVPEVEVLVAPLREGDLVLIVASDGVFDVLEDSDVLRRCLGFRRTSDAGGAALAIVEAAGRAWARQSGGSYSDDASCMVFFL